MVNLNIKPGVLFVIAQFVCIGVSSNVLCLAFLKQHTPGLNCAIRKGNQSGDVAQCRTLARSMQGPACHPQYHKRQNTYV